MLMAAVAISMANPLLGPEDVVLAGLLGGARTAATAGKAGGVFARVTNFLSRVFKKAEDVPGGGTAGGSRAGKRFTPKARAEIDAEKAKLELTEGGSTNVIREYEDRAKLIERLRAKLIDDAQQQADLKHGIQEIRGKWEERLEAVVAKINEAFSDSFARIGCAGQVAVYKASSEMPADCTEENGGADNGLDFANWAIHISVKFREQEPLSLLDSHRQSGGERAVISYAWRI